MFDVIKEKKIRIYVTDNEQIKSVLFQCENHSKIGIQQENFHFIFVLA